MPDKRISALPAVLAVNDADLAAIVQAGVTDQCTVAQIRDGTFPATDPINPVFMVHKTGFGTVAVPFAGIVAVPGSSFTVTLPQSGLVFLHVCYEWHRYTGDAGDTQAPLDIRGLTTVTVGGVTTGYYGPQETFPYSAQVGPGPADNASGGTKTHLHVLTLPAGDVTIGLSVQMAPAVRAVNVNDLFGLCAWTIIQPLALDIQQAERITEDGSPRITEAGSFRITTGLP